MACEDAAAAWPGTVRPNGPARCSTGRPGATNGSALPAPWPAPRPRCARRAGGAAAGQRGRPQSGWDSLTPTEHAVAGLVAEGLSNPQIGGRLYISGRTVQTHLAHMFAKLDISARAQLAAEVTRRQRDEPER